MSGSGEAAQNVIDLPASLDNAPLGAVHFRVVGICFLVAMFDGFDLLAMSFAATEVARELGVSTTEMGGVFSAGLLGLMVGAFGFGELGDRFGRKPVIVICCLIMAILSLMTVLAKDSSDLVVLRFLTGLGLGGVMPNVNALTAEFAPARFRASMMTVMFSGFSLGAFFGALLSSQIVPAWGWRSVFYIGGLLPLASVVMVIAFLPESLRFRSIRRAHDPKIGLLLAKIDKQYAPSSHDVFIAAEDAKQRAGLTSLFRDGRGSKTLLLWGIFFLNLTTMYSLMSWLPTILQNAGMPAQSAILSLSTFNLAGVLSGIFFARRLDRTGADSFLSIMFFMGGLSVASFSVFQNNVTALLIAVFVSGLSISGLQFVLNAIVVSAYPTSARTTALGWALGVGRIGAIIGPFVLGLLISKNVSIAALFSIIGIPTFLCGVLFFLLQQLTRRNLEQTAEA